MNKENSTAIALPPFISERFENFIAKNMQADKRISFDFSAPEGEQACLPENSVSWRVFKNPIPLYIGGISTMFMELAEPRIRAGAWDRGALRSDTAGRLRRTGFSTLAGIYAPHTQFERHVQMINVVHSHIKGTTACGQSFQANDPDLLNWTHNVSTYAFAESARRFTPSLPEKDTDQFIAEATVSANMFGATGAAKSMDDMHGYFDDVRSQRAGFPKPEKSEAIFEFMDKARQITLTPRRLKWLRPIFVRAAIDVIPEEIRTATGLDDKRYDLSRAERSLVSTLGSLGDRIVIKNHPAIQACMRLNLPEHYLFRDKGDDAPTPSL